MILKLRKLLSLDSVQRHNGMYHLLNRFVKLFDLRLYDLYTTWYRDPEILDIWIKSGYSNGRKAAIEDRKFLLYQIVKSVKDLDGDTAECGVYKGMSSYFILRALEGTKKTHHMFDSFEGLSAPDEPDSTVPKNVFSWKAGNLAASSEEVKRNLGDIYSYKLYKGWIPARFNEIRDACFCFVHVDVDLYKPTYDSLDFFYPRLVAGGIIVCDDYGFSSCPGAKKACDEFLRDKKEHAIHVPTGQAIIIKS